VTPSEGTPVLLPERWRVQLMTNHGLESVVRERFSSAGLSVLDWGSSRPTTMIVAAIDPSTAEAILKASGTRCVVVDVRLSKLLPAPGIRRLERRALGQHWTTEVPPGCPVSEIWDSPGRYFLHALEVLCADL